MEPVAGTLQTLIAADAARRGTAALVQPGDLARAARSLSGARRVLIATGFYVPGAGAAETDGPPGARALGEALSRLGIAVDYVTDAANRPWLEALGLRPLHAHRPGLLEALRPTHLVAVERVGRARDGRYYDMRGEDLSAHVEPLDALFLAAPRLDIGTVGIGDGGNEVGMGRVAHRVAAAVPFGARIACTVPTDALVAAGTSNWGAYGLVAALGHLAGRDLLPDAGAARTDAERLADAGAVDGVSRRRELTVDGLPLHRTLTLLERLRAVSPGRSAAAGPLSGSG